VVGEIVLTPKSGPGKDEEENSQLQAEYDVDDG
jgi:hypothetical protein